MLKHKSIVIIPNKAVARNNFRRVHDFMLKLTRTIFEIYFIHIPW